MIAKTPHPPYYAVIFTSIRTEGDSGYSKMADEMEKLVATQPGFLGFESARNDMGITVSYWKDLESVRNWKENNSHTIAREKGRISWYRNYKVRIAKVESDYGFEMENLEKQ
jgi:heme-degrading monooxygenase HmoA